MYLCVWRITDIRSNKDFIQTCSVSLGFGYVGFFCSVAMSKIVTCVDLGDEKSNQGKTKAWLRGSSYVTVWIKSTLILIKATNGTFLFFFVVLIFVTL